ncbi:MAG: preprotein translocase subunit SecA [Bacteroidetes bacterium]|nr:MAG: preprotein translocase subunit SecA [Bacteroidota bacterium]REK06591.1 MAG: preprotein translocase subunit SecA [Bacteroidota bacterium]REK33357.1 MAG: preprotein translocase subunit SecA [Bacteroidota bacterium]REK49757.1 MAG: preprotein translocase subunit SecA [Bacteroidota bacterium]
MLGILNKAITKIFGSKSEKDLKELGPIAIKVIEEYQKIRELSNDQLRNKTQEFKARISEYIQDTEKQISDLEKEAEADPEMDLHTKEDIYRKVDQLKKERNKQTEEILTELLPEAFAVVRETARRFTANESISATAKDIDRNLAPVRDNISISGDQVTYKNSWLAAGNTITWNMVHYDVQLIGGSVLHQGKIAEMATGEGKTLVATLPIYLNALAGRGVHVVTVNDYLAKRDSEWNGPIFEFLGLTVDCIDKHEPNSAARRNAYLSDITYGTNNEFGFDYLRDNMARNVEDMVQRGHHFAIVDEVDSVLIDDARTPLIISGPTPKGDHQEFDVYKPKVDLLVKTQRDYITTLVSDAKKLLSEKKEDEAGLALFRAHRGLPKNKALIKLLGEPGVRALMQKTENFYLQDQQKEMHKADATLYFVIDEKNNNIELTEKGIELMSKTTEDKNFFVLPDVGTAMAEIEKSGRSPEETQSMKDELMRDYAIKSERIHTVNQLLKAYTLFEKDVEYIIVDGKIKIVDEQTGRVMEGRRYSDGLHQAIEAKENVKVEAATQTYATITLQNYFRLYHKLAGMTGTAETEAQEFWTIYKLDVVSIPTNKPIVRKDEEDKVYKSKREKYNAVIEEIEALVKSGRPVLVGTTSVEISELLSRMLKLRNIRHNVLNAKLHQKEAQIVAEAGFAGTVTIATNMAGRGTDIKLGPGVKDAGGLAIIGTEKHESRRVDRQLRGRAGRQGDPGSSQFYVSLEDDLMRVFGSDRIVKLMDRMGIEEGEVIQHSMITSSIERAQRKVEENNFGIRKRLIEYDDVMNSQREVIYTKRRHAIYGERLSIDISNMMLETSEAIVSQHQENRDFEAFQQDLMRVLSIESPVSEQEFLNDKIEKLSDKVFEEARRYYRNKTNTLIERTFPFFKEVNEKQGATIQNIVVPFTDGKKGIQVVVNVKKAIDSQGREVQNAFERLITAALIDDAWKEHLRELDDLKQSVQGAVYEQKDPLLIYKFESFELFRQMIGKVNRDIISFLFKAVIPQQNADEVREARPLPKNDLKNISASKADASSAGHEQGMPQGAPAQPKIQPVRVEQKIGRNEPCPCGSGKKYKNCHGANA